MRFVVSTMACVAALAIFAGCDDTNKTKVKSGNETRSTEVGPNKTEFRREDGTRRDGAHRPDADTSTEDQAKQHKEDLKKELKAQIDATDASIKVMEGHAATATGDAKKRIEDDIKDLRSRRDDLQKHHDQIDSTKADSWDKFKIEARKASDDLKTATQKLVDKFKK